MSLPTLELALQRTADGSMTLRNMALDEPYHSMRGAVQESTHVFIRSGLEALDGPEVDVLEVGLGTGLNLLLTWIRCLEGKYRVRYTALEPRPVPAALLNELAFCGELAWPGLHDPYLERMQAAPAVWQAEMGGLSFRTLRTPVEELAEEHAYDLIYFDAFGPRAQPDLWSVEVFSILHRALRPGGRLVTYCSKGVVRRNMIAAGLLAERLPGPPGKREMLRATRPQ